jgi:RNA recognition motif-containing protein
MGSRLHVGNLSFQTTEQSLKEHFAADGRNVAEVAVVTDRATGQSRGFGFVTMGSDADAQAAITALNGVEIDGRAIKVSEARERTGGPRS